MVPGNWILEFIGEKALVCVHLDILVLTPRAEIPHFSSRLEGDFSGRFCVNPRVTTMWICGAVCVPSRVTMWSGFTNRFSSRANPYELERRSRVIAWI